MKKILLAIVALVGFSFSSFAGTSTGSVTSVFIPFAPQSNLVPPTPSGMNFISVTPTSAACGWIPGANSSGNSTATTMFVQISFYDQSKFVTFTNCPINITSLTVYGMPSGTNIYGRVIAWDGVGTHP